MALIQIDHLVKTYMLGEVEVHALRGVTLEIRRGEFVAIMVHPDREVDVHEHLDAWTNRRRDVILDGIDVSRLTRDELALSGTASSGSSSRINLLSRTSAIENVELPLLYGTSSIKDREERAVKALGWWVSETGPPLSNQLSGGSSSGSRSPGRSSTTRVSCWRTNRRESRQPDKRRSDGIFQELNEKDNDHPGDARPDIAQFAKRHIIFRDGRIKSDRSNPSPKRASEVMSELPRG